MISHIYIWRNTAPFLAEQGRVKTYQTNAVMFCAPLPKVNKRPPIWSPKMKKKLAVLTKLPSTYLILRNFK